MGSVSLLSRSESSLALSWERPTAPNGLIIRYTITAEPVSTVGLSTPLGSTATSELAIDQPLATLAASVSNLEPATSYSVTLTAYTIGGGGGSGPAVTIATTESGKMRSPSNHCICMIFKRDIILLTHFPFPISPLTSMSPVPIGVQPPTIVSAFSRSLSLEWTTPTQPNGFITRFDLFLDNVIVFSGPGNVTQAVVAELSPFTVYSFLIQACTSVGCTNSTESTGETLPDSPSGLAAPNLTALSPSSIEATWLPPAQPNGEILSFELLLFGQDLSQNMTIVSGLNLSATITGLTPNTQYSFQLLVFNAGGSTAQPCSLCTDTGRQA